MTIEIKCKACSETFPDHVIRQFGGMCPACVAGFAEIPESTEVLLEAGATFGRCEILNFVGRGGMGVVYRARQPELDRVVALKVLSSRLAADAEFVRRFEREAKTLAKLSHPHIVTVHDCGIEAGSPFLVMEYVEGVDLRHLLIEHKLSSTEALRIVPQMCDALEYAHTLGVVHRDIKPENILVDPRGRIKIADFGLAMLLRSDSRRLTQTGIVMGTPSYMAPEQVETPGSVDHRADIYSLGVVFYEMLTGELPLGRFAPPSQKVQIDVRLDDVVLRTLVTVPRRQVRNPRN